MGKKKKSSKFDESDEDTLSTISFSSTTEGSVSSDFSQQEEQQLKKQQQQLKQQQDENSQMEGYIDALYEKRSTTREAGLKGLTRVLTANVMEGLVTKKGETLAHQFLTCAKRGSSSEVILACRALGLLALTSGAVNSTQRMLEESFPHLSKIIKTHSSPTTRTAAIESLAILTFVGGVESASTEEAMELFGQIFQYKQALGMTPFVKAAAISAWSFLLTTVLKNRINSTILPSILPVLSSLLEAQDPGIKKASGEAVALLYVMTEPATPEASKHRLQGGDRVMQQLKALADDGGNSDLRNSFRDLVTMLDGGGCKETKVKFRHGDVLKVTDWTRTVQLNAIRKFLAEGFQKHMEKNSLLHEIFNYVPSSVKIFKDKGVFIESSKQRDLERRKKADVKEAGRYIEEDY